MMIHLSPDLEQLVRDQMASGKYATEEELLRQALCTLAEQEEHDQAVAEYQSGDPGVPLDEAVERIRQKYQVPRSA